MDFLQKPAAKYLWLLVRLWLGYEWITAGLGKIGNPAWTGDKAGSAVTGFLKGALQKAATGDHPEVHSWFAGFVNAFALPNAKMFSYLVAYGEFLVGLGLILGLFTAAAAWAGILMNLSYLWAGTSSSNPEMLVLQLLLLFAGPAGAAIGLDYFVLPWLRSHFRSNNPY